MTTTIEKAGSRKAQREATRGQILATAEKLVAEYGFDGVSVRQIAEASGVDLSLILYHFQSKDGLFKELVKKSALEIIRLRHTRVAKALEHPEYCTVENILSAFSEPWVEMFESRRDIAKVFARSFFDHSERQKTEVKKLIDPETEFFLSALKQAAPNVSEAEVHRCYHLFTAALTYFVIDNVRIVRLSGRAVGDVRASMRETSRMIAHHLEITAGKPMREEKPPIALKQGCGTRKQ